MTTPAKPDVLALVQLVRESAPAILRHEGYESAASMIDALASAVETLARELAEADAVLREIAGDMSQPLASFSPIEKEIARCFIQEREKR